MLVEDQIKKQHILKLTLHEEIVIMPRSGELQQGFAFTEYT